MFLRWVFRNRSRESEPKSEAESAGKYIPDLEPKSGLASEIECDVLILLWARAG